MKIIKILKPKIFTITTTLLLFFCVNILPTLIVSWLRPKDHCNIALPFQLISGDGADVIGMDVCYKDYYIDMEISFILIWLFSFYITTSIMYQLLHKKRD